MVKTALGLEIRRLRKSRKLTFEALSHNAGVAVSFLKAIEAGQKQPSVTTIFKIAYALDVDPGDILKPVYKKFRTAEK